MRTPGRKESQIYRLRLDDSTLDALKGAVEWFHGKNVEYSQSCIVRAAVINYFEFLQSAPESDFAKIAGSVEGARGLKVAQRVR